MRPPKVRRIGMSIEPADPSFPLPGPEGTADLGLWYVQEMSVGRRVVACQYPVRLWKDEQRRSKPGADSQIGRRPDCASAPPCRGWIGLFSSPTQPRNGASR